MNSSVSLLEFDFGKKQSGKDWQIINDGVMGGLSDGEAFLSKEAIIFEGKISLENNGGFSSLKSAFDEYDLSNYNHIEICYKSNDYQIGLTFETSYYWFQPYYKFLLKPTNGEWRTEKIKLSDFDQIRIGSKTGRKLKDSVKDQIVRIGFITSEKRAGDFYLEVDYLRFTEKDGI